MLFSISIAVFLLPVSSWAGSEQSFEQIMQERRDSENLRKLHNRATKLIIRKRYKEAENVILAIIQNYPNDVQANMDLGEIYVNTNEYAKARKYYEAAFNNSKSYEEKANIKLILDSVRDVLNIDILDKFVPPKPVDVTAKELSDGHLSYAKNSAADGNFVEAEAVFNHLLNENPDSNRIKLHTAIFYQKAGRYDEAAKLLNEILANDPPEHIKNQAIKMWASLKQIPKKKLEKVEKTKREQAVTKREDEIREELNKSVLVRPIDSDDYFSYANTALATGNTDAVEDIYLYMLGANPLLERIRLDLATLYHTKERYREAQELYGKVLENENLPDQVREKVERAESAVLETLRRHKFSGSLSVGFNQDTNANSAASSGEVTFGNVSIPLEDSSRTTDDSQVFVSAAVNHTYKFKAPESKDFAMRWNSNASIYNAEQVTVDALDLFLTSYKTGPLFDFKKYHATLGTNIGYNYIRLADEEYLRTWSADISGNYFPTSQLSIQTSAAVERRHYTNTPTSPTNFQRSGNAYQVNAGFRYALTQKDIFGSSAFFRSEDAREELNSFDQINLAATYTRILPYDLFMSTVLGYKKSDYKAVDPFISTTVIREDKEHNVALTLGRTFLDNITATLGYQYRNIDSTLQNFEYTNHRASTSLSWGF